MIKIISSLFLEFLELLYQQLLGSLDLLLAREKHDNVTERLRHVNLKDSNHARVNVVCLRGLCVIEVHWKPLPRDPEDRRIVKKL
jgi:hypothetical protein